MSYWLLPKYFEYILISIHHTYSFFWFYFHFQYPSHLHLVSIQIWFLLFFILAFAFNEFYHFASILTQLGKKLKKIMANSFLDWSCSSFLPASFQIIQSTEGFWSPQWEAKKKALSLGNTGNGDPLDLGSGKPNIKANRIPMQRHDLPL